MNSFSLINASMNIDTSKRAKGEAVTSRLIVFTRFVYMQREREVNELEIYFIYIKDHIWGAYLGVVPATIWAVSDKE
jgi:hypothetical protein